MRAVPAAVAAPPLIMRKSRRIDKTMALVAFKKLGSKARINVNSTLSSADPRFLADEAAPAQALAARA